MLYDLLAVCQCGLTEDVDYTAMLAYEYFITLGDEVKYFWKRRSLGPSALFYMNRYLNLILSIYQLIVLNPAYHRSPEVGLQDMTP